MGTRLVFGAADSFASGGAENASGLFCSTVAKWHCGEAWMSGLMVSVVAGAGAAGSVLLVWLALRFSSQRRRAAPFMATVLAVLMLAGLSASSLQLAGQSILGLVGLTTPNALDPDIIREGWGAAHRWDGVGRGGHRVDGGSGDQAGRWSEVLPYTGVDRRCGGGAGIVGGSVGHLHRRLDDAFGVVQRAPARARGRNAPGGAEPSPVDAQPGPSA